MMDRCRPDEGEQADVNKNESKNAEALTISNRYILLALFARSTMRTTSDMMRFNSKFFGVYPLSWQKRTLRGCVAMSANDAVDGAHSAASKCHRVVASKRNVKLRQER